MLPSSTLRRPSTPSAGAVMRLYCNCRAAESTAALSDCTVPSYWRARARWLSYSCRAIWPPLTSFS